MRSSAILLIGTAAVALATPALAQTDQAATAQAADQTLDTEKKVTRNATLSSLLDTAALAELRLGATTKQAQKQPG